MTSPIDAVSAGFSQYAQFSGRATRSEFWWWMLFTAVANLVLSAITALLLGIVPLSGLFGLAVLLPTLAVTCRRLHDIGKSGWWQLLWAAGMVLGAVLAAALSGFLAFIVLGVIVWSIIWMVRQGEPGDNDFGPDPRAVSEGGTALPEWADWYDRL